VDEVGLERISMEYFVSYAKQDGFGNAQITRSKLILGIADLLEVSAMIEKNLQTGGIVILYFVELPQQ